VPSNPQQSALEALLETLTPEQRAAVSITKLAIDCFNSSDGTGLFTGMERYGVLGARLQIAAVQADSLTRFWALLLRRMNWPVPPKAADARIVSCLSAPNGTSVLRVLASEAASVITLARMAHDADKATRRALRDADKAAAADLESFPDQDWPQQ
jgi:hypothetical protein